MADDTRWADFRQLSFGDPYMVWHDGPDFGDIRSRYAADPAGTSALIELGLDDGDPVAAQAVSEVEPVGPDRDAWVERLTARLPRTWGPTQVAVAMSLYRLTGSTGWADPVTQVLADPSADEQVKLTAAMRLRDFPASPTLVAAVGEAVRSPYYLVRYHAANTLLSWSSEASKDLVGHDDLFTDIVADPSPDGWAATSARLQEMALGKPSV